MNPSTILSALSFRFSRSFAQSLLALLLTFWLLPSPLVRAQTGAGAPATAQSEVEARTLKMDEPMERELAVGQYHIYQITLAEGQYLKVVVEQRGIDVAVKLYGPDGSLIFRRDAVIGRRGQETMA